MPSLSDDAVAALDGWSVHTWDDYAENGEGHAFLEARWQIFVEQVEARDPTKPIIATEMGSKDTVFDGATYLTPDSTGCGAASEADGYAIRMLAHVAVALTMGADGITFWESADQTWQCSNWGMVDTEGDARRYSEALATFTAAFPDDGGTVLPASADLPTVAVLGASGGAVLVVNDSAERLTRTVAVTGGWSLVESRGFATSDRLLRDELADFAQVAADADLAIDAQNTSYFDSDFARAYRNSDGDAAMVWTPGGDLVSAEIVAWSWPGEEPVAPVLAASEDGVSWQAVSSTEVRSVLGWNRHAIQIPSFPSGSRSLRVTLPTNASPAWSPQLGDISVIWTLDTPAVLPRGEAPWTVDLPAGSAVVLVLQR